MVVVVGGGEGKDEAAEETREEEEEAKEHPIAIKDRDVAPRVFNAKGPR